VTVAVRDTGPGIPLHERALLFQPFSQTSSGVKASTPGTGLGSSSSGASSRPTVVASGRLAQISQRPPEIVLIDMAMPGLSGVEALPRILALAPGAAVIMVSGAGDNEIVSARGRWAPSISS
jgi:CheY-like chemotaxis protein